MASPLLNLGLKTPSSPIDGTEDVPGLNIRLESIENAISGIQIPEIPPASGLNEGDVSALIDRALAALADPSSAGAGTVLTVNVSSGNQSVSSGDFTTSDTINITGATVAGRTVTLPATAGSIVIVSARSNTKAVKLVRGTATYNFAKGGLAVVYLDGTTDYMKVLANANQTVEVAQEFAKLIEVTATTLGPTLAQADFYFRCTHASGCTITIPANSTQAFPINTSLTFEQAASAGPLAIANAVGVTVNVAATHLKTTVDQYAVIQVKKVAADTWTLFGNLERA